MESHSTLWVSHQSTLGLPVTPAALMIWVGFTCNATRCRPADDTVCPGVLTTHHQKCSRPAAGPRMRTGAEYMRRPPPTTHPLNVLQDGVAVLDTRSAKLPLGALGLEQLANQAGDPPALATVHKEHLQARAGGLVSCCG